MNPWDQQCCAAYPDCLHPEPWIKEECDHENAEESHGNRGIDWRCNDCGAEGHNRYAATYGVSDADFI